MLIIEKKFDATTGEEIVTERDATAAEIEAAESFAAEQARLEAENATKATEKAAILAKLGLTADEVAALLS